LRSRRQATEEQTFYILLLEHCEFSGFPVVIMAQMVWLMMLLVVVMTTSITSDQSRSSLHDDDVINDGGKSDSACTRVISNVLDPI